MNYNKHFELKDKHSFLSPSNYQWLRYDDEKLQDVYFKRMGVLRGTKLHALASTLITMHEKLPRSNKTLNAFVNDAIGFGMQSELVLKYSNNCFGTADALSFKKNILRIHDLKTGETKASFDQLLIYAALFCLEYSVKPADIKIIARIYQYDDYEEVEFLVDDVVPVMDTIKHFDILLNNIKQEEAF